MVNLFSGMGSFWMPAPQINNWWAPVIKHLALIFWVVINSQLLLRLVEGVFILPFKEHFVDLHLPKNIELWRNYRFPYIDIWWERVIPTVSRTTTWSRRQNAPIPGRERTQHHLPPKITWIADLSCEPFKSMFCFLNICTYIKMSCYIELWQFKNDFSVPTYIGIHWFTVLWAKVMIKVITFSAFDTSLQIIH